MYISVVAPSARWSRLLGHAVHRAARSYLSQWWFFWTAIGAGDCDELYAGAQALYGLP
jgi:hypothetical protein